MRYLRFTLRLTACLLVLALPASADEPTTNPPQQQLPGKKADVQGCFGKICARNCVPVGNGSQQCETACERDGTKIGYCTKGPVAPNCPADCPVGKPSEPKKP